MINVVCGIRSTGRICTDLALELSEQGHEVKIAYGREEVPKIYHKFAVKIGNEFGVKLHGMQSRIYDGAGFGSKKATIKFIEWVKDYDPDIIHLHNLHGYYINIEILFDYLKGCGKQIIWTLHDCWSFTGHCTYFDYVGCEKWKNECYRCEQKKEYPVCKGISRAEYNFRKKREIFKEISNMTIITPSKWLAELVKKSYLKDYTVDVIHNGIDTTTFHKVHSNIKEKYGIRDKKVILGVAASWNRRKGLKYMVELSERLDDGYVVVVIGLSEKQKKNIPSNMIGILKTNSVQELVEWYSVASVYVNPTLEDNYPTTNLEAIACGTPVVTFNTGGSPESAEIYGEIAEDKSGECLKNKIEIILNKSSDNQKVDISKEHMLEKYLTIYDNKKE